MTFVQRAVSRSSTEQHGAARSSTEQHGAARSSTEQHGAARSSTEQHGAARSSTEQHCATLLAPGMDESARGVMMDMMRVQVGLGSTVPRSLLELVHVMSHASQDLVIPLCAFKLPSFVCRWPHQYQLTRLTQARSATACDLHNEPCGTLADMR